MSVVGAVEWFEPGEYDRVERVLEHLGRIGLKSLRTGISWADAHREDNAHWFQWLVPRLARDVEVVPCLARTPPAMGVEPSSSSPPADPQAYADFVQGFIGQHGDHFAWIELWDQPNGDGWDRVLDPDGSRFATMVGGAARVAREAGKKVLLGGMSPVEPHWLESMFRHGLMEHVDAVGIHGFPRTFGRPWRGWSMEIQAVQDVLDRHGHPGQLWVSAAGHSTVHHDVLGQLRVHADLQALPVRVYWHTVEDRASRPAAPGAPPADGREHHFGLWRQDGTPKLLAQALTDGRDPASLEWLLQEETVPAGPGHVVITGGAGFIGTNLAHRLLEDGRKVLVFDDLSRPGSLHNLEWLHATHGNALRVRVADVRDQAAVERSVAGASAVFHLAAQVAVTTSMHDPRRDFHVNAEGTLNVLEAVRKGAPEAFVLYASTNKVYGSLDDRRLTERATRWEMRGRNGGRGAELSFATPYGCSKGAADQYVLDYARNFGLLATSFRMSCIYGPMQNGNADQGWVAHFLRCARDGDTLTIYGDGKQVRDMLHVDDLIEAYLAAMERPDVVSGRAWDIGGGAANTSSLVELLELMEDIGCALPPVRRQPPRPSDQLVYVADTAPLQDALGWRPRIGVREGVQRVWQEMTRQVERVEVAA